MKYFSLLVEENPYSASPFRCAWVEIFELFQHPQPDRRLALTSLLVYHKQITTCQTDENIAKSGDSWTFILWERKIKYLFCQKREVLTMWREAPGKPEPSKWSIPVIWTLLNLNTLFDTLFSQKEKLAPLETNIKGEKDMCRHDLFLRPDRSRIVFHFFWSCKLDIAILDEYWLLKSIKRSGEHAPHQQKIVFPISFGAFNPRFTYHFSGT